MEAWMSLFIALVSILASVFMAVCTIVVPLVVSRLFKRIDDVQATLGKRIDDVNVEVKVVQTRLQEHERNCAAWRLVVENRLTKLEASG